MVMLHVWAGGARAQGWPSLRARHLHLHGCTVARGALYLYCLANGPLAPRSAADHGAAPHALQHAAEADDAHPRHARTGALPAPAPGRHGRLRLRGPAAFRIGEDMVAAAAASAARVEDLSAFR